MKKLWLATLALLLCGISQAQVTSTTNSVTYACNGVTTAFPVTFKFIAPGDLVVTGTPSGGVARTYLFGTDYTVAGGKDATGTVTTMTRGLCANAGSLIIARSVAPLQPTNFRAQGNFSPALHQTAFDRLTMSLQDLATQVSTNAGPPGAPGAPGAAGPVDTTALTLAGSKTRVFYQTTQPTNPQSGYALQTGDLWFDTTTFVDTDGRTKTYYNTSAWSGSAWVATPSQDKIVAKEIAAGAITADKIAAHTITAGQIASGTITATEIAASTITADKLVLGSQALTDTSVYHMHSYATILRCSSTAVSLVYPFGVDSVSVVSGAARLSMTLPVPPAGLSWTSPMIFAQRGPYLGGEIARDNSLQVKQIVAPVGGYGTTTVDLELLQGTSVQAMCGSNFVFYVRVDWLAG